MTPASLRRSLLKAIGLVCDVGDEEATLRAATEVKRRLGSPTVLLNGAAVLDRTKVDAVFAAAGIQRRGIYVFSVESGADGATAYSRLLPAGGLEDPATGSAVEMPAAVSRAAVGLA